jgi:nicotinate-nucleotide adenylyltransferase
MRRIAFFGGSFDPPHCGHLAIARAAADRFSLDQVLFTPVGHQPLKQRGANASFLHRYAMTVLATQTDSRFTPSLLDAPLEAESDAQPNYTVDTLARLRTSLEAAGQPFALFTLLGADSWLNIAHWKDVARLLSLCDWIVAARPGFSLVDAGRALPTDVSIAAITTSSPDSLILRHSDAPETRAYLLRDLDEDISATQLRATLRQTEFDVPALPAAVQEYIRKTGLYSGNNHPATL